MLIQLRQFMERLRSVPQARMLASLAVAGVSLVILAVMTYPQRDLLADALAHFRWQYMAASAFVYSLDLIIVAVIWGSIVNSLGGLLPLTEHVRIYCLANVGKRLPGTIWYVAGRSYLYRSKGINQAVVSAASAIEFVVALIAGLLSVFCLVLSDISSSQVSWTALVGFIVVGLLLVHPRSLNFLVGLLGIRVNQALGYANVVRWIGGYVVAWLVGGCVLFLVASGFSAVAVQALPFLLGSWAFAGVVSSLFFFLPLNMGVTEISLSLMLSSIMPLPLAAAAAIAMRVLVTVFEFAWALAVLWLATPRLSRSAD